MEKYTFSSLGLIGVQWASADVAALVPADPLDFATYRAALK